MSSSIPYLGSTGLVSSLKSPYVLTNKDGNKVQNGGCAIPMSDSGSYKSIDGELMRSRFIRKVFFLVLLMLLIITGMSTAVLYIKDLKDFFDINRKYIFLPFWIVFGTVYLIFVVSQTARRFFPVNLILATILVLSISVIVMTVAATSTVAYLLQALAVSIICCTGIIIYASVTKYDLTRRLGILIIISLFLGSFSVLTFVTTSIYAFETLQFIGSFLGTALFMAWLAIDTQMLIGGKRFEIKPEDTIFVTIQLFVDAIFLFLYIFKCLFSGGSS